MTKEKEIGYEVINCIWRDQEEFRDLWNTTDIPIKDIIVEKAGRVAIEAAIPTVAKRMKLKFSLVIGLCAFMLGIMLGFFIAPKHTTSLNIESAKSQLGRSKDAIQFHYKKD